MHFNVGHIVVPSGSAGTHAGMLTGINGINAGIPIIGSNVLFLQTGGTAALYAYLDAFGV